ncbi:MAG: corC 2 [Bacteroidetes bacterium]|jgi:putative hemolysin|nr:corC 2 [Bacteroidota bacterium]MDF2451886.1 corC 2 [Bacteroidota bacterium]
MTEIIIILVLFILNGLFAMCEIALVSSRRSRLEQRSKEGSKGAHIALKLLKEPEKFLSTVQIGITLVGIIAGAYGGEAFTKDLQPYFERITWLKDYAEEVAFISIIVVITYFSLIIGELVPKSIALNNPERITIALAPFMRMLAIVTYPFVVFLSVSTKAFLKIFMIKENKEPPVTEDELKYMIETGSQYGVIEKQEGEIMHSVFKFGDRTADNVMTGKRDIVWINVSQTKEEILALVFQSSFTKFPVGDESIDRIIGTVSLKDIMLSATGNAPFDLRQHLMDPIFFPQSTSALRILDTFRKKQIHIGFVVNEYGGTEGLITLHDLVENIIGDFPEIGDQDELKIIEREDGSFLVDAEIEIDTIKETFKISSLPNEKNYKTLAGFMINQMHSIPKTGDCFALNRYKFEIVDMDRNRIDKVLITPVKENKN